MHCHMEAAEPAHNARSGGDRRALDGSIADIGKSGELIVKQLAGSGRRGYNPTLFQPIEQETILQVLDLEERRGNVVQFQIGIVGTQIWGGWMRGQARLVKLSILPAHFDSIEFFCLAGRYRIFRITRRARPGHVVAAGVRGSGVKSDQGTCFKNRLNRSRKPPFAIPSQMQPGRT